MIDYIGKSVVVTEEVVESYIFNFDEYVNEKKKVKLKKEEKPKETKKSNYLDFNDFNDHQINRIKELYIDKKELAKEALKVIGKYLKDNTFVENSEDIIDIIKNCYDSKKEKLSSTTYDIISRVSKELKDKRSHDYYDAEEKKEEKSEKSEE